MPLPSLSELLRTARARHPQNTAVIDPGLSASLTYEQLGERSDHVTAALLRHGARPGDRVGICAPKSVHVVATIHGVLGAGAAYVPVDAASPVTRIAGIFADCSVAFIVASAPSAAALRVALSQDLEQLEAIGGDLVLLRGLPVAEPNPVEDAAYILYTSGSTGKPKGVVHTHSSAMAFIDWCSEAFEPSPSDRFSSHAPFHFDLSILDLYVPVAHGASVVIIGEDAGKQPLGLAALIAASGITIWYSTPSILRLLADHGRLERHDATSLRLVLFAGEVFPMRHLRALMSLWPHPRYFNLYGPTETNVCTAHEVPTVLPATDDTQLPIGKTCGGDRARVVDASGADVPFGAEGELVISGGTVMSGYWGLPERNATAFIVDDSGVRWYRTGDMVCETSHDGFLFRGRRDRMVKRRGYRVELGEIEAALSTHHAVAEAAVAAVTDDDGGVRIDAFLTQAGDSRPSIIQLKQFCAKALPAYMIPDRFIVSDSIPRTSTGKIDYTSLARAT